MNFKGTLFLFGLLLAMLWLFGLTVARQKTAVDASFLLPTLQAGPDVVINSVTIQRRAKGKEPETFQFTKDKDVWTLQVPGVHKSVKLESFRVEQMVRQIRDARRSDEAGVTNNLSRYGLDKPSLTITLQGAAPKKKEQEWKFFVGQESPDQLLMYVNTSDRPNKVFGITKSSIDSVFFKDPNHLRARRLFEFSDSAVREIDIKEAGAELELKKGDDAVWRFEKPPLGIADFEGPPPPKNLPPGAKPAEGGVKGLLAAIATIRVDSEDDFVPLLGAALGTYGLEPGKEAMRIEVDTLKDTLGKKETAKETLALGSRLPGQNQIYGRLLGDDGVFKVNAKLLEPINSIVQNPATLRSRDVATIDTKKVDAVTLTQNKEAVNLLHPDGKPWDIQIGSAAPRKANGTAIEALLAASQGKGEIAKFVDGDEYKKLDAEMKTPVAVIAFYEKGLEEPTKDKKDTKAEAPPKLRKDAKPALALKFAGLKADTVDVERVLADGTTSRFLLPRSAYDKIVPADIALAFLDNALPAIAADDITRIEITRAHGAIDITKSAKDGRWNFKDTGESANKSYTDAAKTSLIVNTMAALSAKRWLRKIEPKDDLTKYGLKSPAGVVTLHVRQEHATTTASLVGLLATQSQWRGVIGGAAVLAKRQTDLGETIVLKTGNETTDERDKPAHYALRSDKDMLFLLPDDIDRMVRELDLHDRTSVVSAEPLVAAATLGLVADLSPLALVSASPLASNRVQGFDSAKVKEISLAIRTPQELRNLTFQRDGGQGKSWRDLSGLKEFELDSQKVSTLAAQLAALRASRWVNLAGGAKAEQKLTARMASLRIEVVLENDRTITLTVGAPFEPLGYYAQTSAMPEAVFLLAPDQVTPLMAGPAYFAKDKLASR